MSAALRLVRVRDQKPRAYNSCIRVELGLGVEDGFIVCQSVWNVYCRVLSPRPCQWALRLVEMTVLESHIGRGSLLNHPDRLPPVARDHRWAGIEAVAGLGLDRRGT